MNEHLTDIQIQDYLLDPIQQVSGGVHEHIGQCQACQNKVLLYRELFEGLAMMDRPSFSNNLADQVLSRVPSVRKKSLLLLPFLTVGCGLVLAGLIYYLLPVYFFTWIPSKDIGTVGLIILGFTSGFLFLFIELLQNYRSTMKYLDTTKFMQH